MSIEKRDKSGELVHNFDWINTNRVKAFAFAETYDPFRKPAFQKTYNSDTDDAVKIVAYETRVEFSLVRAKNSNKTSTSYPLGYEFPPYEYHGIIRNMFEQFMKELAKGV
jgi:hypothetical protein